MEELGNERERAVRAYTFMTVMIMALMVRLLLWMLLLLLLLRTITANLDETTC